MLSRLEEKREDVAEWERRAIRANRRVESGKYEYTQVQDEEDGLSAGSIDDEMGLQNQELQEMEAISVSEPSDIWQGGLDFSNPVVCSEE